MKLSIPSDAKENVLNELKSANMAFQKIYPGELPDRQPVHTVYGGANRFKSDTPVKLGQVALKNFLERNLHNPKEMEEGEAVSVKINFVVGYDGKLQSFVTIEDGGEEFNKEVVRVLKKMPDWIPGKSKGQNVSVYYTIPVKFIAE